MKKFLIIPLLFCLPCYGAIITIEADDYPIETPISDSFDYITLRAGTWKGFEGEIVAVPSSHTMQLLGEKVLGYSWDIEWWKNNIKFRIIFDGFAKSLSVKILGKEGFMRSATELKGYNSNNELITHVNRKAQAAVVTLKSELENYDVAYYELYSYYPVAFDHIVIDYQPIPEPSTILLFSLIFFSVAKSCGRGHTSKFLQSELHSH